MISISNHVALVDSCFWFALLDETDSLRAQALDYEDILLDMKYIIPWPTLYETLGTRLMRRPHQVARFNAVLNRANAVLIPDKPYREAALEATLSIRNKGRAISLVDSVLRFMVLDTNIKLDCLTFPHFGRQWSRRSRSRPLSLLAVLFPPE
jgi:hypothetical protein